MTLKGEDLRMMYFPTELGAIWNSAVVTEITWNLQMEVSWKRFQFWKLSFSKHYSGSKPFVFFWKVPFGDDSTFTCSYADWIIGINKEVYVDDTFWVA